MLQCAYLHFVRELHVHFTPVGPFSGELWIDYGEIQIDTRITEMGRTSREGASDR